MKGGDAHEGDLIEFFKEAGLKTYWLSNQYYLGPYDTKYSAIAYRADKAVFLNNISGTFLETGGVDDQLLAPFSSALEDPAENKIIFIHLMGSHAPFIKRYPKGFGNFNDYSLGIEDVLGSTSKAKTVDSFDNSIEFTDTIVTDVINKLKDAQGDSFMLFFPDHGVDVYDEDPEKEMARNEQNPTRSMYEIPFILWLSDNYKKDYAEFANKLPLYLDRPYQTDRVTETIIDLARLTYAGMKEENSVVSDKFKVKERLIGGKAYAGKIDKNP